ncbi:hypothetical protein ED92_35110 [Amycolatopsis sp. MJM2582]|nr:hypothetical protein ED92_35110 [Amycolatopsis sp. MJM2582]
MTPSSASSISVITIRAFGYSARKLPISCGLAGGTSSTSTVGGAECRSRTRYPGPSRSDNASRADADSFMAVATTVMSSSADEEVS